MVLRPMQIQTALKRVRESGCTDDAIAQNCLIYSFSRIEGGDNLEARWPRAEIGTDGRISCSSLSDWNLSGLPR